MKYLDYLTKSAEYAETKLPLIVEEASLNLNLLLLEIKKELANKNETLEALKKQVPLNFTTICNITNAIALLRRKQNQLTELQKELF